MGAPLRNNVEVEMSKGWIVTHKIDDNSGDSDNWHNSLEITTHDYGMHFSMSEFHGADLSYAMSVEFHCTKAEARELFDSILRNMPDDSGQES